MRAIVMLVSGANGTAPLSPIFVTFSKNPGTPDGGPASGFSGSSRQTH
jgi:hypothetical protein